MGAFLGLLPAGFAGEPSIRIDWRTGSNTHVLKTLTPQDLAQLKQGHAQEPAPGSTEKARWKGPLLSELVNAAMEKLPAERRAQVDLLILYGKDGVRALLPRA